MRTLADLLEQNSPPLLAEELSAFSVLDKPDIGLWIMKDDDVTRYYLFNTDRMDAYLQLLTRRYGAESLQEDMNSGGSDDAKEYGLAAFSFSTAAEADSGPCLDGNIIQTASALRGYGPAMYELLMARGVLMPDRSSVTGAAAHVWLRFQGREDVAATKLDDRQNPKTPPKIDDCQAHRAAGFASMSDVLNHAVLNHGYEFKSPSDKQRLLKLTTALKHRGRAVAVKHDLTVTRNCVERHARAFFRLLYI